MKNTVVVNLFGGPGTGKSTGAAYIFSKLKMMGIDSELVTEFAKDKVWEKNDEVFKCQFYITGKQVFKISRCYGKVDVIVTDSPIIQGLVYGCSESFSLAVKEEFNKYNNINFLLKRKKEYNENGRYQTEDEAEMIDVDVLNVLFSNNINYDIVDGDESGYDKIVSSVVTYIKRMNEDLPYAEKWLRDRGDYTESFIESYKDCKCIDLLLGAPVNGCWCGYCFTDIKGEKYFTERIGNRIMSKEIKQYFITRDDDGDLHIIKC